MIVASAALGKTQQEVLDILKTNVGKAAAEQAKETGFDAKQTDLYLEAHRKAYESLAEEFNLH